MLTVRSVQKGNERGRVHVAPTLASAIAAKRELNAPAEAQAARILLARIRNEPLGLQARTRHGSVELR